MLWLIAMSGIYSLIETEKSNSTIEIHKENEDDTDRIVS